MPVLTFVPDEQIAEVTVQANTGWKKKNKKENKKKTNKKTNKKKIIKMWVKLQRLIYYTIDENKKGDRNSGRS